MKRLRNWLAAIALIALAGTITSQLLPSRPVEAASNVQTFATTLSRYVQRGQTFAGLGPDVHFLWEDFATNNGGAAPIPWAGTAVSSGSYSSGIVYKGGVIRFQSGATANSSYTLFAQGNSFSNSRTDRWYQAWRFKVQTAVDAQTIAAVGIAQIGGGVTVTVGVFGSQSTVNFQLQYDGFAAGSFVSTGVAIDTNFHVVEFSCIGDNVVHVRMDGGAQFTATQAVGGNDQYGPWMRAANGTTAANRAIDADWSLTLGGRS